MSLPDERSRALVSAREFLFALLDPKQTPRVPSEVRKEARRVVKHYPAKWEIEQIAAGRGKMFFGKV